MSPLQQSNDRPCPTDMSPLQASLDAGSVAIERVASARDGRRRTARRRRSSSVFRDARSSRIRASSLDITDAAAVSRAVGDARPDVIINCAAFNDVDGAESAPLEALAVNAFAVRNLARAARRCRRDVRALQHRLRVRRQGDASRTTRARPPSPQSTYAASKLLGEWFALDAPRAYVLRVESLFGARRRLDGPDAARSTPSSPDSRPVARFACSPTGSCRRATRPTSRPRHGTWSMTGAAPGLYHCVNAGQATWHEVARGGGGLLGVTPRLRPGQRERRAVQGASSAVLRVEPGKAGGGRLCDAAVAAMRCAGGCRPRASPPTASE